MARYSKGRKQLVGKTPGSVVFVGNKRMEHPMFRVISYNETSIKEYETGNINELLQLCDNNMNHWINVDGLHETEAITSIGKYLGLQPLELGDIVNTDTRPKINFDDNYIFMLLKQLSINNKSRSVEADHLAVVVGEKYIVTFQERVNTGFEHIRERLRKNDSKIRLYSPNYLAYRIMDSVVDDYLTCIEALGDRVDKNEDRILKGDKNVVKSIYLCRSEIAFVRKNILPATEVSKRLKNSDHELIDNHVREYLSHLDDLLTHANETNDIYYNLTGELLNIHNTNIANRTNEAMMIMTIFASIFIPLTFIVGVYGTNFDVLPELHFKYGYFIMWGVMLIIAAVMIRFFKKRGWI